MLFTSDTFDNYLNGPLVVACTLTQAGKSIHTSVGIHVCVCVCVTQQEVKVISLEQCSFFPITPFSSSSPY